MGVCAVERVGQKGGLGEGDGLGGEEEESPVVPVELWLWLPSFPFALVSLL